MSKPYPVRSIPKSIAIFGAHGRMGRPLVDFLRYAAPDIPLRLLASSEAGRKELQGRFPDGDILLANYFDPASLGVALKGMEGIFVVTPPKLDEHTAMTNFVNAARQAGSATQIIRLVGYAPEWSPKKYPSDRLEAGGGHFIAKAILDESGLPTTYVNLGATLMDNLFFNLGGIRRSRTLIWPERSVPMMDVRDLGEVIARLFLVDDARYVGSFLTLNNGYDYPTTTQLARVMSNALLTPISCETGRDAFLAEYGPIFQARYGAPKQAEILWDYFEWEHANWLWELNDTAERLLGRRPNTLHNWLVEHRSVFLAKGT